MSDLSPESRALLGREGPLDEPSGADLDARREAIFRALGVPPPAALPMPTADALTQPSPPTAPRRPVPRRRVEPRGPPAPRWRWPSRQP